MSATDDPSLPLVVAITGATGAIYGVRVLEVLRALGVVTHLVVSKAGEVTLRQELGLGLRDLRALAGETHPVGDIGASIASGSFRSAGMIVAPCSVRTLSAIAYGLSDNLVSRAADVVLKERRRLVLMLRESPLNLAHLRAMVAVTEAGAVLAPPVPAFYAQPASIDDLVNHTVVRALDLFGLPLDDRIRRWDGLREARLHGRDAQ